ncbi:PXDN [Branchiostoma lanceolatum]|uniref:PXDN protein n=1 Tax=Branchiostoma lanceolatum TaxID=7740 RepID=A0A8K0AH32_BRALA|nr:PXDN [Branchiostoma lanceolatum]
MAIVTVASGAKPSNKELRRILAEAISEAEESQQPTWGNVPVSLRFLKAFHPSKPMAVKLSKSALVLERIAKRLTSRPYGFSLARLSRVKSRHVIRICDDTSIGPNRCPTPTVPEFRRADGRCNNRVHPLWGSAEQPFERMLQPKYDDGISAPRTKGRGRAALPTAKRVSITLHEDMSRPHADLTHMVMQWGQFLDHDFTLTPTFQEDGFDCTCDSTDERCFNIPIPDGEPDFSGMRCLPFSRSRPCPNRGCRMGRRQQINQITTFIDASNVYGSSDEEMEALRDMPGTSEGAMAEDFECEVLIDGEEACSQAGDVRVNEQPGLTSMHTLFLREHNRIARRLSQLNPSWDDDRVFYETRKIVGALMQKVTYGEFLPYVIGPNAMARFGLTLTSSGFFTGYKESVNPSIFNVFATALFRFGHSLVQNELNRGHPNIHTDLGDAALDPIDLASSFFNPIYIRDNGQGGPDSILRGLTRQPHQDFDPFMVPGLTRHLFAKPSTEFALDLAALNIQRGRDHGLPGYNDWRRKSGLRRARNFGQLASEITNSTTRQTLQYLYNHVDDIDLFSGALSEEPVANAVVGWTFANLMGLQFQKLRRGDRFWFENEGQFTLDQLAEIKKTSLARILCDNTDDAVHMSPDVFWQPRGHGGGNPLIDCQLLPQMDLSFWQE